MERSKNLHNFNFPTELSWGKQHLLRCMKVNPVRAMQVVEDEKSSDSGKDNQNPFAGKSRSTDDCLKSSLIKAFSSPNEGEENSPRVKYKCLKMSASKPSPPLANLSKDDANNGINVEADSWRSKKIRPRRNLEKKKERPKFSTQLSRKEIEEDFIAMTGKKPPRKPSKPPRSLRLKLDALSPGLWLSEVYPDRYKVNENGKI